MMVSFWIHKPESEDEQGKGSFNGTEDESRDIPDAYRSFDLRQFQDRAMAMSPNQKASR